MAKGLTLCVLVHLAHDADVYVTWVCLGLRHKSDTPSCAMPHGMQYLHGLDWQEVFDILPLVVHAGQIVTCTGGEAIVTQAYFMSGITCCCSSNL
jgi:hypothetical protein